MKRIILASAVLIFISVLNAFAQKTKHVLLVSIDGFRPDFYREAGWETPNLRKLAAEGVSSNGINSVFPSVTYPSHTAIITGAMPARHGIYYNAPYDDTTGHWYWEANRIKVPTLWDAVRKAGLKSGSVMWPVSVGAPIDYNFPVRGADNDKDGRWAAMKPLVSPGLLKEINEKFPVKEADLNYNQSVDETIEKVASLIIEKHKPALLTVHFVTVDHLEHEYGRNHPEVKKAIARVDSLIGILVDIINRSGLKESTTIIITGDHGFVNTKTAFAPNILLAKNGLAAKANFQPTGGSAFLYLKSKNDTATLNAIKKLLDELPSAEKQQFRIIDRKEMDKAGANPEPVMALAMTPGTVAVGAKTGKLFKPGKGGTHGHFPDFKQIQTGFIAAGAGIKSGAAVPPMGVKDVAPLVSALLKLNFITPDGVLPESIIKKIVCKRSSSSSLFFPLLFAHSFLSPSKNPTSSSLWRMTWTAGN